MAATHRAPAAWRWCALLCVSTILQAVAQSQDAKTDQPPMPVLEKPNLHEVPLLDDAALRIIFRDADKDGDARLKVQELADFFDAAEREHVTPNKQKLLDDEFTQMDANGDGFLSLGEHLNQSTAGHPELREIEATHFTDADHDRDGRLSRDEFMWRFSFFEEAAMLIGEVRNRDKQILSVQDFEEQVAAAPSSDEPEPSAFVQDALEDQGLSEHEFATASHNLLGGHVRDALRAHVAKVRVEL